MSEVISKLSYINNFEFFKIKEKGNPPNLPFGVSNRNIFGIKVLGIFTHFQCNSSIIYQYHNMKNLHS